MIINIGITYNKIFINLILRIKAKNIISKIDATHTVLTPKIISIYEFNAKRKDVKIL